VVRILLADFISYVTLYFARFTTSGALFVLHCVITKLLAVLTIFVKITDLHIL
jgi:hypothetical protein